MPIELVLSYISVSYTHLFIINMIIGKQVAEEHLVSSELKEGCFLLPVLFKMYLEGNWKKECKSMGTLLINTL